MRISLHILFPLRSLSGLDYTTEVAIIICHLLNEILKSRKSIETLQLSTADFSRRPDFHRKRIKIDIFVGTCSYNLQVLHSF